MAIVMIPAVMPAAVWAVAWILSLVGGAILIHESTAPPKRSLALAVLLIVTAGVGVAHADTVILDGCTLVAPYSFLWWAWGCWL